jgi:hypothetical protein
MPRRSKRNAGGVFPPLASLPPQGIPSANGRAGMRAAWRLPDETI